MPYVPHIRPLKFGLVQDAQLSYSSVQSRLQYNHAEKHSRWHLPPVYAVVLGAKRINTMPSVRLANLNVHRVPQAHPTRYLPAPVTVLME